MLSSGDSIWIWYYIFAIFTRLHLKTTNFYYIYNTISRVVFTILELFSNFQQFFKQLIAYISIVEICVAGCPTWGAFGYATTGKSNADHKILKLNIYITNLFLNYSIWKLYSKFAKDNIWQIYYNMLSSEASIWIFHI